MSRWKRALAYVGFVGALLAVGTGRSVIAWVSIVLLGLALGLRVVERVKQRRSASARDTLSE